MPTELLEKKSSTTTYCSDKTATYKEAYEPELLQKEIECCIAATD